MKWTIPGHQFDNFAEIWDKDQSYFLWGAAYTGEKFITRFRNELRMEAIIDSDALKHGKYFHGLKIISPEFLQNKKKGFKIIVTSGAYWQIRLALLERKFKENIDFCDSKRFTGVYMMYRFNRMILPRVDISVTNKCTLKCRDCNMLIPYFPHPEHRPLAMIKEDLRAYFQHVDYLDKLNLLGGEPFLHPELEQILEHIFFNYGKRIDHVELFSNATVLPSDNVLNLCRINNVSIQVSDYTVNLPKLKLKLNHFLSKLDFHKIKFNHLKLNEWLDFCVCNPSKITARNNKELIHFFDLCSPPFRGLYNRRLYFCHLSASAEQAGLYPVEKNDFFDLQYNKINGKMLLLEFDAGYLNRGYVSFCAYCNGCHPVNSKIVKASIQL